MLLLKTCQARAFSSLKGIQVLLLKSGKEQLGEPWTIEMKALSINQSCAEDAAEIWILLRATLGEQSDAAGAGRWATFLIVSGDGRAGAANAGVSALGTSIDHNVRLSFNDSASLWSCYNLPFLKKIKPLLWNKRKNAQKAMSVFMYDLNVDFQDLCVVLDNDCHCLCR